MLWRVPACDPGFDRLNRPSEDSTTGPIPLREGPHDGISRAAIPTCRTAQTGVPRLARSPEGPDRHRTREGRTECAYRRTPPPARRGPSHRCRYRGRTSVELRGPATDRSSRAVWTAAAGPLGAARSSGVLATEHRRVVAECLQSRAVAGLGRCPAACREGAGSRRGAVRPQRTARRLGQQRAVPACRSARSTDDPEVPRRRAGGSEVRRGVGAGESARRPDVGRPAPNGNDNTSVGPCPRSPLEHGSTSSARRPTRLAPGRRRP